MNIDPLGSSGYIPHSRINGRNDDYSANTPGRDESDSLSAGLTNSVRDTLASLPEVRPDVVARGRQLAADPSYPGPDIVKKIASLITPLSED